MSWIDRLRQRVGGINEVVEAERRQKEVDRVAADASLALWESQRRAKDEDDRRKVLGEFDQFFQAAAFLGVLTEINNKILNNRARVIDSPYKYTPENEVGVSYWTEPGGGSGATTRFEGYTKPAMVSRSVTLDSQNDPNFYLSFSLQLQRFLSMDDAKVVLAFESKFYRGRSRKGTIIAPWGKEKLRNRDLAVYRNDRRFLITTVGSSIHQRDYYKPDIVITPDSSGVRLPENWGYDFRYAGVKIAPNERDLILVEGLGSKVEEIAADEVYKILKTSRS